MGRILAILAAVAVPLLMSSSGSAQEPRVAPVPPTVDSAFDAQRTAFAVGPGRALTALKPDDCANPLVDGKPARFERTDAKTGLAILSGDFAPEGKPPGFGALAPDLIALSYGGARVAANSASLGGAPRRPFVLASLEKSASGAPLFDRRGGLVGVVAPIGQDPKRVAGVALAAAHPIVEPQAVRAFLGGGEHELVPEPLTAGALAERERGAVVAVSCRE
jgi:hypothetical protein